MADITFLHTSPVHVATFDALLKDVAPQLTASHLVREDLLDRAQRQGLDDPGLLAGVRAALQSAAANARVVVCSCSTIGGLAEATPAAVPIQRIDRAMADDAVQRGKPVLMVAALQSTLQPTAELLQSSADRLGLPLVLRSLWVEAAWPLFESGQRDAYLASIAVAVRKHAEPGDTIVLAQASMAGAAELLADTGLVVLSSPRLGLMNALRFCEPGQAPR
ncbi:MAG: aspartate/glutamate racemase family protein [Rhizobacter sp.]